MPRIRNDSLKVQSVEVPTQDENKGQKVGTPSSDLWQPGTSDGVSEVKWRVHSTSLEYIRDAGRIFRRYDLYIDPWLTKLIDKLVMEGSAEERQAVYLALTENRVGKAATKVLLIFGAPIGWGVLAVFGPSGSGAREYTRFVREVFRKDQFMEEQAARLLTP